MGIHLRVCGWGPREGLGEQLRWALAMKAAGTGHPRVLSADTSRAQPWPSDRGWGGLMGAPLCAHPAEPSPGSSGVPQPTQTQSVPLWGWLLAVHISQDLSSPHPPAKAKEKG